MQLPIAQPRNTYLVPQRDLQWRQALALVLAGSAILLLALGLVGWPRLKGTSINYELMGLRKEVRDLERVERALVAALEYERSPARLAVRASEFGLAPPAVVIVQDSRGGIDLNPPVFVEAPPAAIEVAPEAVVEEQSDQIEITP